MNSQALLRDRKAELALIVRDSFGNNRQSDGFALRVLSPSLSTEILGVSQFDLSMTPQEIAYGGFPEVAYFGYGIGFDSSPSDTAIGSFIMGVKRLQDRSTQSLETLVSDDVALLGIADGLAKLSGRSVDIQGVCNWLLSIADNPPSEKQWSFRMRLLSADLLDDRCRLRTLPDTSETDELALEIVLRHTWPQKFLGTSPLSVDDRGALLKALLVHEVPKAGDMERAVVWRKALDVMVDLACQSLSPTVSDTARLLANVQHSLKRWVWKDKPRRANTVPSRWLIDDEFDVQSLLWAVLYPVYGADLVDETYLPNWGNVQPRADLGIIKLKLIIEVKIARHPSDFASFEGQIGEDLGLYFKDTDQFDRMIVFIYDDCDKYHPEKHDGLRNALLKRGEKRIEDVVFVRRPGMIPNRDQRG